MGFYNSTIRYFFCVPSSQVILLLICPNRVRYPNGHSICYRESFHWAVVTYELFQEEDAGQQPSAYLRNDVKEQSI